MNRMISMFMVVCFVSMTAGRARADEQQCRNDAYATYQAALTACGGGGSGGQTCATGARCDNYYGDGTCRQWVNFQVCGRYCATGRACDNRYGDGTCREWRTTAACGDGGCSTGQVCDNRFGDGTCREWGTEVSCN